MADNSDFKEVYNGWYFLGALGVLLVLPLMHILAGVYQFVLSNLF